MELNQKARKGFDVKIKGGNQKELGDKPKKTTLRSTTAGLGRVGETKKKRQMFPL